MTLNSTQRLADANYAITHGQDTCYDLPSGKREDTLKANQDDYRLACNGGICTVQHKVPKATSFSEDALQALAAVLTLGLTSCSSEPAKIEWRDVSEFKDASAEAGDLASPADAGVAEITDTQPVSQVCIDSDGNNPFDVGFVVTDPNTPQKKSHIDVCKDSSFLYEQTCDGNQYKNVIVKCKDVLPGGICVENAAGGKCDLAAKYIDEEDASATEDDTISSGAPDVSVDVPQVDYLKNNPLPLALNSSFKVGSPVDQAYNTCSYGKNFIPLSELSNCIYLKAVYDLDGTPIVGSSYTDLLKKIADSKFPYVLALVEGDNVYPKTSAGKVVAFQTSQLTLPTFNSPQILTTFTNMDMFFYEASKPADNTGCYVEYSAPNGFASCVK